MIATARGLAIACAIALVLAIVVGVDPGAGGGAPVDRSLVAGFDGDAVTALVWPGRNPMGGDVRVVKSAAGWAWREPAGDADARTVEDVLAALRGARWQRRAEPVAAGRISATLVVERPQGALRIEAGETLAGAEQQWLVIGGDALLVDSWVVRALVPDPIALRLRAPLASATTARELAIESPGFAGARSDAQRRGDSIESPGFAGARSDAQRRGDSIEPGLVLRGFPRHLVQSGGQALDVLVAPALVDPLERAFGELAITALPARPLHVEPQVSIALDGRTCVAGAAPCTGGLAHGVAIVGPRIGIGCVDEAAWDAIGAAGAVFHVRDGAERAEDLARIVERRPAPVEPVRIVLADGAVLELAKRPRVGDRDADPVRTAELQTALATAAEPVAVPARAPVGAIEVAAKTFAIRLDLYGGGVVARHGEPIALRVADGAYALLVRPGGAYRDPTLWREEPSTIRALTIAGTRYPRGAVVGEWSGAADGAALEQLANLLGAPQSRGDAPAPPSVRTLELEVAPPSGPIVTHALAVARTPAGCAARVDGAHVLVDPQICALVERVH